MVHWISVLKICLPKLRIDIRLAVFHFVKLKTEKKTFLSFNEKKRERIWIYDQKSRKDIVKRAQGRVSFVTWENIHVICTILLGKNIAVIDL